MDFPQTRLKFSHHHKIWLQKFSDPYFSLPRSFNLVLPYFILFETNIALFRSERSRKEKLNRDALRRSRDRVDEGRRERDIIAKTMHYRDAQLNNIALTPVPSRELPSTLSGTNVLGAPVTTASNPTLGEDLRSFVDASELAAKLAGRRLAG